MGAWGMKPFENDGAGDLEAELSHGDFGDISPLNYVISTVLEADYIESDLGEAAIATAAIIAFTNGATQLEIPARLQTWLANSPNLATHHLVDVALKIIDQVDSDAAQSELYELWQETADFAVWQFSLTELRTALSAARG